MLNSPLLPAPTLIQRIQRHWGQFKALATPTALVGLAIVVVGLAAVGLGGWAVFRGVQQTRVVESAVSPGLSPAIVTSDTTMAAASTSALSASPAAAAVIWVDVSGAVQHPGVYTLPDGSRVSDAIATAGGFTKAADSTFVSQQLNLAKPLTDGQKLYIFTAADRRYQAELAATGLAVDDLAIASGVQGAAANADFTQQPGQISINHATSFQLEELPGIGAKRAEAIIAGRPYQRLAELTEKKILSTALFDEIADNLTL